MGSKDRIEYAGHVRCFILNLPRCMYIRGKCSRVHYMWSPDKNAGLLAALLPPASQQTSCMGSEQWASMDFVRGRVVQLLLAKNNGTLNDISPQHLCEICDRVVAHIEKKSIPFLPPGATCFCGGLCNCSERFTVQYDVRNIDAIASASMHSILIAALTKRLM